MSEKTAVEYARSVIVNGLICDVEKHIKNDAKQKAAASILTLGVYRATEAVPLLVKHIDFSPLGIDAGRPYRLSESVPCVYALGKIGGRQCHDAMLDLVAKSGTYDNILSAKIVLTMSLGHDDAVALIQSRAAREKDRVKARHLSALAKSIEMDSPSTSDDD